MVNVQFEKPSNWSKGQIIGFVAVILLILGPFLPYFRGRPYSYIDIEYFGLLRFIPFLSAILIVILLFLGFPMYAKRDWEYIRINHFVLILWGGWFLFTYILNLFPLFGLNQGIGILMIIGGFLMCTISGFIEWRYPSKRGTVEPIVEMKHEIPSTQPVAVASSPQQTSRTDKPVQHIQSASRPLVVKTAQKRDTVVEPAQVRVLSTAKPRTIKAPTREPVSDEEKILLRWARHIDKNNQTYEMCIKCQNYVFIKAEDMGDAIIFSCPDCNEIYKLKK
jgi:hypothetical protein